MDHRKMVHKTLLLPLQQVSLIPHLPRSQRNDETLGLFADWKGMWVTKEKLEGLAPDMFSQGTWICSRSFSQKVKTTLLGSCLEKTSAEQHLREKPDAAAGAAAPPSHIFTCDTDCRLPGQPPEIHEMQWSNREQTWNFSDLAKWKCSRIPRHKTRRFFAKMNF